MLNIFRLCGKHFLFIKKVMTNKPQQYTDLKNTISTVNGGIS